MTTTLISRSALGRARTGRLGFVSTPAVHRCATTHTDASLATVCPATAATPATGMNTWLGGSEQGSGFDSKYAIKRISPGCLEGMT